MWKTRWYNCLDTNKRINGYSVWKTPVFGLCILNDILKKIYKSKGNNESRVSNDFAITEVQGISITGAFLLVIPCNRRGAVDYFMQNVFDFERVFLKKLAVIFRRCGGFFLP